MGFDIEKFENANFKDRIETVPVPRLKRFFKLKKGEEPVWIIRGLTGFESALARQEVSENQSAKIQKILEAIGSKLPKTVADAVKAMAIEDEEDVPDDLVQRYLWLERCSVDPVCSHDMAMKLANEFPEDFYLLTNKIVLLTGAGRLGE